MSRSEDFEGGIIRFWQVSPGREEREFWPEFKNSNIIAMGWDRLRNLKNYSTAKDIENALREYYPTDYPKDKYPANDINSIKIFSQLIKEGDVIIAKKGASREVYGIGKVLHKYHFDETRETFKHIIDVDWIIGFDDKVEVETSKEFVEWTANSLNPTRFDEVKKSILARYPEFDERFDLLMEGPTPARNWWIEKTLVKGRPDRETGEYSLGKALWSPQEKRGGGDYYKNMRAVQKGDIVLHLIDNEAIVGISIVNKEYDPNFFCLPGTPWDDGIGKRPAYLVTLRDYQVLKKPIHRSDILNEKYKDRLLSLLSAHWLFYNKKMELNQGSYLTEAPPPLVEIINEVYKENTGQRLPSLPSGLIPTDFRKEIAQELIEKEPEYSEVIRTAFANLIAGKNLVIYGPPATSKTYLAKRICEYACGVGDFCFHTANGEWSYFDIVGGLILQGNQTGFKEGILLEATEKCRKSVADGKKPCWLIIDELNRANLDLAFGKIFTQLDLDYRDRPLETVGKNGAPYDYFMPLSFRILATMNTYDRALLFSLGYAFMRRFAFIPLESLLKERESVETETKIEVTEDMKAVLEKESVKMLKDKTKEVVFNHFSKARGPDKAFIYSELGIKDKKEIDKVIAELKIEDLDVLDILIYIADKITNEGLVEIGHGIIFDAAKFIVAHSLLFPDKSDPGILLDEAVVSYLLPQLEYFMPKLRKGRIFEEERYRRSWERITQITKNLNIPKTSRKLKEAEEEFKVIR